MFAALTFSRRRPALWRAGLGGLGAFFLLAALTLHRPDTAAETRTFPLAYALASSTWALAIPTTWLAAPAQGVRPDDRIDLIAVRGGDRAGGYVVALDVRVMTNDDRVLLIQTDEASAIAVAIAHTNGSLLVPLLQSAH
jgi:hypothetical protein